MKKDNQKRKKPAQGCRYSDAVDPRCTLIPEDGLHQDPIPSDWRHGPNGELLAPDEPDPLVVPEETDD